jgi:hypothetical protein
MNRLSKPTLRMGLVIWVGYALASSAGYAKDSGTERKPEWKAFDVTYQMDPDYKDGPSMDWKGRKIQRFDEQTSKIWIPAGMEQGETIRGVMPKGISGLDEFAYRNRIALYDGGANQPWNTRGLFSKA